MVREIAKLKIKNYTSASLCKMLKFMTEALEKDEYGLFGTTARRKSVLYTHTYAQLHVSWKPRFIQLQHLFLYWYIDIHIFLVALKYD